MIIAPIVESTSVGIAGAIGKTRLFVIPGLLPIMQVLSMIDGQGARSHP